MKKYFAIFGGAALAVGLLLTMTDLVKAEETTSTIATSTDSGVAAPLILPIVDDIDKRELRQSLSISEIYGRAICKELNRCPLTETNSSSEVLIKAAKVTEVGANFLNVLIFGSNYKVDLTGSKIVRYGWSESGIDEFSVGDIVNVFGYLDESDNHLVHAKTVRNVSIQKIHSVFKGTIESIDATSTTFVLKTEERGNQTVAVSADTKIIKSQFQLDSFSDLQIGMKVIVRGLWNKTLSKIQSRLIVIGSEKNQQLFFEGPKIMEKIESKVEKVQEKIGKRIEGGTEGMKERIEEIQKKIAEILTKLNTTTTTSE